MKTKEAQQLLTQLLQSAGYEGVEVTVEEKGDQEWYFNISVTEEASQLIGHKGEVLVALQQLMRNVFRQQEITEEGDHFKLDVDSYRSQQEGNVLEMAEKRAKEVLETGTRSNLPPMSSFFRRIVHIHIKDHFPQLVTESRGVGNDRAVVITMEGHSADEPANSSSDPYADIDL